MKIYTQRWLDNINIAEIVFGHPIEKEGITLLPVAKLKGGFGFGLSSNSSQGEGGGGGVSVTPIGYIEIRDGVSHYKKIKRSVFGYVMAVGVVGLLAYRLLSK